MGTPGTTSRTIRPAPVVRLRLTRTAAEPLANPFETFDAVFQPCQSGGWRRVASRTSGDSDSGAESAAVRRHCLLVVHGRGGRSPRAYGGPVLLDRVLWQRPAVPGHDVCLCSDRWGYAGHLCRRIQE